MDCCEMESCCFCIPLRWGSAIIAVILLGNAGIGAYAGSVGLCTVMESEIMWRVLRILGRANYAFACATFFMCIFLFICAILDWADKAIYFVYVYGISLILSIILMLVLVIMGLVGGCFTANLFAYLGASVVSYGLSIYFLLVVNAYAND